MKFKVSFYFFVSYFFRYRGSMPLRMAIFTVFLPKVTLQQFDFQWATTNLKVKMNDIDMIFAKAVKTMPESRSCYKGHCLQNRIWKLKTQYYTTRMNPLIILSDKWQSKDRWGCRNFLKFPASSQWSWFTLFRFAYLDIL